MDIDQEIRSLENKDDEVKALKLSASDSVYMLGINGYFCLGGLLNVMNSIYSEGLIASDKIDKEKKLPINEKINLGNFRNKNKE